MDGHPPALPQSAAPLERQILAALPQVLLLIAADGTVLYANAAAEAAIGRSAAQLAGRTLHGLFGGSSAVATLVERATGEGAATVARDVELAGLPGIRCADVHAVPVAEGDGQVLLILDVRPGGSSRQTGLALSGAARSASGLAQMLAHEIRNPLAGIRGAAQLLERGTDARQRSLARLVRDEVDRISRLLDRLDAFSDDRPLPRRAVNIHALLDHVRALMDAEAESAGVTIEIDYDPSLPAVLGHWDSLVQIFINLVKNAIQASETEGRRDAHLGEITLRTACRHGVRRRGPQGEMTGLPVEVVVADSGPGIDPSLERHIFEPFVTSRPGGRGLGLALVARLVEAHGGLVEVDSAAGSGTAVRVLLPAATEDAADE
ncbi:MAG: nitrogen regulation protein NR(II) [Rhodothalassiaceae bacterium]